MLGATPAPAPVGLSRTAVLSSSCTARPAPWSSHAPSFHAPRSAPCRLAPSTADSNGALLGAAGPDLTRQRRSVRPLPGPATAQRPRRQPTASTCEVESARQHNTSRAAGPWSLPPCSASPGYTCETAAPAKGSLRGLGGWKVQLCGLARVARAPSCGTRAAAAGRRRRRAAWARCRPRTRPRAWRRRPCRRCPRQGPAATRSTR
jgi:hypothetical protein